MARFVSLSIDAAPTYAAWAPVTARLWRRIGYTPIVHTVGDGWDAPFAQLVLRQLEALDAWIVPVARQPPLSVANTARAVRIVAASHAALAPDDFVLMADVDMLPLNREFFDRRESFLVLRPLYHVWERHGDAAPGLVTTERMTAGAWQFPMCYPGATTRIWRELWPMAVGDAAASLRSVLDTGHVEDRSDYDERCVSHWFLGRVATDPIVQQAPGRWSKGELVLVDPVDAPHLSMYSPTMPRGLLRLRDLDIPAYRERHPGAIDFIPCRFPIGHHPWEDFDVASLYYPEEADAINAYRRAAMALIG